MGKDKGGGGAAANWEKKKEKLDKKKEVGRGAVRSSQKIANVRHKENVDLRARELRDAKGWTMISVLRTVAGAVVVAFYVSAMLLIIDTSLDPFMLTVMTVVTLVAVSFGGASWQEELEAAAERAQKAKVITNELERKQTDEEKEQRRAQRRVLQLVQLKERLKRRAEDEKAELSLAKELASKIRRRREEREAEEAREAKAGAAVESADDGGVNVHGWTVKQLRQLREAVTKFPELARGKPWKMIAAEVDGQDMKACEAMHFRLESEARARAEDAKAAKKSSKAQSAAGPAQSQGLDDDFDDFLGDCDTTTDMGGFDDSDDEIEEDEEEACERMAIEVEPEHKGTEIRLEGIKAMQGCATVQVEVLHLQLSCAGCKTAARVYLSGADEDSSDAKLWCEGCSGLISVRLRPTLLHQFSSVLCYVDCVRCNVADVLPSVLTSVCENCDAYNVHKQEFTRNRTIAGTCFSCHSKYGFGAESIRIEQITPCDPGGQNGQGRGKSSGSDDPMDEISEELRYLRKKVKTDKRETMIVLGRQLPNMGACGHFKKSYKWYRFACCGRAFPCPQCHIESECPAAALGAHASRMICGKCSMEQSYSPSSPCEKCNFAMIAKGSSHWDGGDGARNIAVMSSKDAKKFRGVNKTSSAKADRVGVKAKKAREHTQKFGKD